MNRLVRMGAWGLGVVFLWPMVAGAQWVWTPETGRFINVKRLPKETPELQVEFARSLLTQGAYRNALDETEKFEEFYAGTEESDENQFLRGEVKEAQGEYRSAAREYQQVVVNYPDSDLYDAVIEKQYGIGDALFERGEKKVKERRWYGWGWRPFRKRPYRRASEIYAMVIDNKPFAQEAAQAQYKVGLCSFAREEYVEAAFEYRRVIEDYPGSEYVAGASHGLAECYEASSLGPQYDQAPSRLTIEAIDEFKARFPQDPRGNDLAGVRREMRENMAEQRLLTARHYERRRALRAARIYYEVLVDQFEETEAAGAAREWLAERPLPDRVPSSPN